MTARTADAPYRPGAAPLAAVGDLRADAGDGRAEVVAVVPIRADEESLRGHFPDFPVFPGIFVIEALTQAVDRALSEPGQSRLRLRAVGSVRFLAPLLPPDTLTLRISATAGDGGDWAVTAEGRRSDDTVAVTVRARFGGGDA